MTPNHASNASRNIVPMGPDKDSVDVEKVAETLDRDVGVTTVEILAWMAMLVVAIVVIAGLLQALGVDVINYVRTQIGL